MLNISVQACAAGKGKISVYTSYGIEVFSNDFVSEFESIDISNWNSGVYMVVVTDSDGNTWTEKFVKRANNKYTSNNSRIYFTLWYSAKGNFK